MEEYPHTLMDFDTRFGTDEACQRYVISLRWPDGFRCPRCGRATSWRTTRTRWTCAACHRQTSVTAGTIFHHSHQSLRVWFKAIWWVTNQKTGLSALGLQRALELGSYRTAWLMLHKLRHAMVRPHRERLRGQVEVDETYVGGVAAGPRGRGALSKTLVAVAAEADGLGIGRIRLYPVADASAKSLVPFVQAVVEPGSLVVTDGWEGYAGVKQAGYRHRPRPVHGNTKTASTLLPRVHRVAALLKRWLLGTHQGRVDAKHLSRYLDEFTFRFNRRKSLHRGKLFYRLVQHAVALTPPTYATLVQAGPRGSHKR